MLRHAHAIVDNNYGEIEYRQIRISSILLPYYVDDTIFCGQAQTALHTLFYLLPFSEEKKHKPKQIRATKMAR